MDVWQAALEDVGPAGVDKGNGGKYLILPPDYNDKWPEGYIVLPSSTYEGFGLLRSIIKGSGDDAVKKAIDYGLKVKLYPLSQASAPPPTTFVDVLGKTFDATIQYDMSFYQSLDRVVQYEPWLPRDKVMIDMLKSIGIEKGKKFRPDAAARRTLEAAVAEAHDWLDMRYETVFQPYFKEAHWAVPAAPGLVETSATFYETPEAYSIDGRAITDYWAFSTVKHLGSGQFYLMSTKDRDGAPLDGGKSYRLAVPANVPAGQYWSAVVYDRATHALIRDLSTSSKSSQMPGLETNEDGSVDLWFGPTTPAGQESNFIPTKAGHRFEVLFRLYAPQKPLFDKTWTLPDIVLAE
jgi:hypothetical protein